MILPMWKRIGRDIFDQLGISENELAIPLQCHSNTVRRADAPGEYDTCDALITNAKHVALIATVADCVPILLFDPVHHAIGIVHAGWRGIVGAIATRAVERMKEEYHIGSGTDACLYWSISRCMLL